jgi:hypothetical protein
MAARIPIMIHNQGFGREGPGGNAELDVPNVSWIDVPVGGAPGVTELGLNAHVDFAGTPTQLKAKVRLDPAAANAVRVI